MNSETIFRIIFFILFICMSVIRIYYHRQVHRSGGSSMLIKKEAIKREGRFFLILRAVMGLFMIAVFILYIINPSWMKWSAVPVPIWIRWIGVGFGILSLLLLIRIQQTLGRYWSTNLQLREEHKLITSGPYRRIRHPMYTALFTYFISVSLLSANWLFILLTLVVIIGLYRRIGKEETMMIEKFGEEYCDYMKRTGRLIPRLNRSKK